MKKIVAIAVVLSMIFYSCRDDDGTKMEKETGLVLVDLASLIESGNIEVNLNPSGIAPLTAELKFTTKTQATTEITVLGDIPVNKKFNQASNAKTIEVLGLYGGKENSVEIKVTSATSFAIDTLKITTDSLLTRLPEIEIEVKNDALMEPGMNLNNLSISGPDNIYPYPMVFDNNGDIRWFLNFEGIYSGFLAPMERTRRGNLLFFTKKAIVEYDMMGRLAKQVDLPAGYEAHHDVIELPNGNYVVAVDKAGSQIMINGAMMTTVEDFMIEINGTTGALVEEWDFRQILDVDREELTPSVNGTLADWFHQNAVTYSEADDAFIVSGRNQGLIKVGRNNTLIWIMAPHKNWGKAGPSGNGPETAPFLLTAVNGAGNAYDSSIQMGNAKNPNFDWTWGQHAPYVLPNGNILVFDNGFNRQFTSTDYSRAVEYEVNDANKTVKQVYTYGEARGAETLSFIISDVDYLPKTENIIFAPGVQFGANSRARIIELSRPGASVIFEAKINFKNERAIAGSGWFDLNYRAERLTLYP